MAGGPKILVVDDEQRITSVLDEFFTRQGYTVLTAKNGHEALERVEKEHPALVLLDIKMPGMDGVEVLRQIKARAPKVEVIMITALKDRALASQSLALGARDYITKPFDLDYLERSVLMQLVGLPSDPADTSAVAPSPPPTMDPALALAQLLGESARPTSAPRAEVEVPAPSVLSPEVEPVAALAAECFRLAAGLTPPRLAREIEEYALGLLEAGAVEGDQQPRLRALRLCLQVAHALGGLKEEELARINTLYQDVEKGR